MESKIDTGDIDKIIVKVDKMQVNLDDKVEFMQRLLNWKAERDEIEKSEKRL